MILCLVLYIVSAGLVAGAAVAPRVAVANMVSQNVTGTIVFTEVPEGVHVGGSLLGLEAGLYGFHVHQFGDISTCDATGGHFNPDGTDHGGPDHTVRHVGDLGNVRFAEQSGVVIATVNFVDPQITLVGRNSILGRAVVLHENEDDLGLGTHEMSLITGNAGPRIACGVIGVLSPADPWNSSNTIIPSFVFIVTAAILSMAKNVY